MSCIVGISGLFGTEEEDYPPDAPIEFFHDAAAAMVVNGKTVAALEEERINRHKHTNRFPVGAISFCLQQGGRHIDEVDQIAYFFEEAFTDRELALSALQNSATEIRSSRDLICRRIREAFGADFPPADISFVPHHVAHAEVTYHDSRFGHALIAVIDGNGENAGISFFHGTPEGIGLLRSYPIEYSLGHFYRTLTQFIGYHSFDEYKVMGLASHGDADRFYPVLRQLCRLESDGNYQLEVSSMPEVLLNSGLSPRRKWEDMRQDYADLAAGGQRLLEDVTAHLLAYWRDATGLDSLCFSGGVAQNTTMNGHILLTERFRSVYVHPASHDAGASLGAAYAVDRQINKRRYEPTALSSVYLGPDLGDDDAVLRDLEDWSSLVEWHEPESIVDTVAAKLAAGEVVGWAQGRSEFGPRALGNRSILADPRPADNRDRVNALIKHRESYRPLAPAVPEHRAADFFAIPRTITNYSYMGFVLQVKGERQDELAAVTHIDGTARVQVVHKRHNPLFWSLIERFGELTGTPVLLNTSFNNHAEPIVQSTHDAITCLLTTDLPWIAIGRYVATKRSLQVKVLLSLGLSLPPFCLVQRQNDQREKSSSIRRRGDSHSTCYVSDETADLIICAMQDPTLPLSSYITDGRELTIIAEEIAGLWERRLIRLRPVPRSETSARQGKSPRPQPGR